MKLKYIDSIRGIAILMVILVHTSQKTPNLEFFTRIIVNYGQMGVQLFFVASAYTLCLSATRRKDETLPLLKFSIRRYFRIAPAYYFGLILYLVISLLDSKIQFGNFIIPEKYNTLNIISNLTFIHGFFPPANNNIVPGGWSIGTEMAFYSIFPILFYISRIKLNSIKNITIFISIGIIFSQFIILILSSKGHKIQNNNFLYFNLLNQLPVFFIGIGYYFLKKEINWSWNWKVNLIFFLFFTFLSINAWHTGIDYLFSVIPFFSGLSFIFLIEIFQNFTFLNTKLLVRIGQVSYSMYILHVIFAHHITGFLSPKFLNFNGTISLVVFYIFSVSLTFGFALLSEKYIEKPSIEWGKKIINKLDALVKFD